jgi:hypothetical protein
MREEAGFASGGLPKLKILFSPTILTTLLPACPASSLKFARKVDPLEYYPTGMVIGFSKRSQKTPVRINHANPEKPKGESPHES